MGCLPWVAGGIAWAITVVVTENGWLGFVIGIGTGIAAAFITKQVKRHSMSTTTKHSGAIKTRQSIRGKLPVTRTGIIQRPEELLELNTPHTKRMRHLLGEAHFGRHRLRMRYETGNPEPGDPKIKTRDVEVYGLGEDYFDAYCHYRGEVRTFKISRVLTARLTEKTFQIPPSYAPSTWVTNGWGVVEEDESELG
jgi:predicted DNA-binding transcriptional regulator YafY